MVRPGLDVDSALRTDGLRFAEKFGRRIRQDPPTQLGVPTMDLALLALRRGARGDALALCQYMVEEFKIVYDTVLNRWLHQTAKVFTGWAEAMWGPPAQVFTACVVVAFQIYVCYWLYQRKIFFKL